MSHAIFNLLLVLLILYSNRTTWFIVTYRSKANTTTTMKTHLLLNEFRVHQEETAHQRSKKILTLSTHLPSKIKTRRVWPPTSTPKVRNFFVTLPLSLTWQIPYATILNSTQCRVYMYWGRPIHHWLHQYLTTFYRFGTLGWVATKKGRFAKAHK